MPNKNVNVISETPIMISERNIDVFRDEGFTVIRNALTSNMVTQLRLAMESLLTNGTMGRDEQDPWACFRDFGAPSGITRVVNTWKKVNSIREVVGSADLGRAAALLAGWPGVRIASDQILWKEPGGGPIAFHQDGWFLRSFLSPPDLMTCWIALDDCNSDVGSLQYVRGSHKWPSIGPVSSLIVSASLKSRPNDYQQRMLALCRMFKITSLDITTVAGEAGLCSFHCGLLWHGSPENVTVSHRRAIAVEYISSEAKFIAEPSNAPMFAEYKARDSMELNEAHFPVVWNSNGYRSKILDPYPSASAQLGRCG